MIHPVMRGRYRALRGVSVALLVALLHPPLLVARAGSWYLLVPPADFAVETHRYSILGDAPLGRWYRDGEYDSEQECQEAKRAKGGEALRLSTTTLDADSYYHAQASALKHGRCVSGEDLEKLPR